MTTTRVFPRSEYTVFKTETPYETLDLGSAYMPTVNPESYELCSLDETETWYIAKSQPTIIYPLEFTEGATNERLEDDYTTVEITETEIIYTEKQ